MCFIGVGSGCLVGVGLMFAHIMIPLRLILFFFLSYWSFFCPFLFGFPIYHETVGGDGRGGLCRQMKALCLEEEDKGVYILLLFSCRMAYILEKRRFGEEFVLLTDGKAWKKC